MYALGSTLFYYYYLLIFFIFFTIIWQNVCSVQYVVLLYFAHSCYFMYSYVAVCMLYAVRCVIICSYLLFYSQLCICMFALYRKCVIIICSYLLFYSQLCSCLFALYRKLCYYYLLIFVILFTVM